MAPWSARDVQFLVGVGNMSGYPRQETILLGYGYPGQGEGAIQKLRFFGGGKVTRGPLLPRSLVCYPNSHLLGVAPHLPHTSAKVAKRYPQYPGSSEMVYAKGVSLPFLCYCSDSCGQISPNFRGSPDRNQPRDLFGTLRDCCPTLSLSGPGDPQSVTTPGEEPWGLKRGPSEGPKSGTSPPVSLARGKGQGALNGRP